MAKIKISAGFSGVISTGSYENMRPSYGVEWEYESEQMDEMQVENAQKKLQEICQRRFKEDEQQAIRDRIESERSDVRWYGDYPSVTSVIGWDSDFFVNPQELRQYAAQGNLIDAQVKHFINTGVWADIKDVDGTWADIVICKKGNLNLPIDGWNFPAFLEKYPVEKMEVGQPVISHKHKYGGTPDIRVCYFDGKKTLADVKRTPAKIKNFKQIAAYIMAEEENGEEPYEQMMIIPLNDKTNQGYSKPITETRIKQYKDMFLRDRENFLKRFGL